MSEPYNNLAELKERRRELRRSASPMERRLWTVLRDKQFGGYKFRRQHSIGRYVLDYYCPALRLAIEVDGETHVGDAAVVYDGARQKAIEALGVRFLRFSNADLMGNLEGVADAIALWIGRAEAEKSTPVQSSPMPAPEAR